VTWSCRTPPRDREHRRRPGRAGGRARLHRHAQHQADLDPGGVRPDLAWLGSALGVPCVPDQFGQSGSVRELYELNDLLPGSVVNAALAALSLT
jgi:hypothetical protein